MENTQDLSKFGYRELDMVADLLKAYANDKYVAPEDKESFGDGVKVEFNPNSGEVFLLDDDYNTLMLTDDGLELWVNCANCGAEGFRSELPLNDENECLDCTSKKS